MTRVVSFKDCCQGFAEQYEVSNLPAMQAIERSVLGCDYGGTSWTTRSQAEEMIEPLRLRPGSHLLDIGAGSGWPGLFLADSSGCDVTLVDLPLNALQMALSRAERDGLGDRVTAIAASGCALPFTDARFDAISHSDVLCCLPEKIRVLEECRRVAVDGARMLFSVIRIAEGLNASDYQRAVDAGPPFIEAPASYPAMLMQTGWRETRCIDVTAAHRDSLTALVEGLTTSPDLADVLGEATIREESERRREQTRAIEAGVMVREIYLAAVA